MGEWVETELFEKLKQALSRKPDGNVVRLNFDALVLLVPHPCADILLPFLTELEWATDGEKDAESLINDIKEYRSTALVGVVGNSIKGVIVCSPEYAGDKRVLMINHIQGEIWRYRLYEKGWPLLVKLARSAQCEAIRVCGRGTRWLKHFNRTPEDVRWLFDIEVE